MTPKVFTLRRDRHREDAPCDPESHYISVGTWKDGIDLCPSKFTRITGLSIPIGGSLRVKLVVVRGKKGKR